MRNRSIVAFAFSLVFTCCSQSWGQTGNPQPITKYSWRKSTSQSQPATVLKATTQSGIAHAKIDGEVESESIRVASRPATAPAAPTQERRFLVGFRQDQNSVLDDTQSSVSDQIIEAPQAQAEVQAVVPNYSQEIPAAPGQAYTDHYHNQPGLSLPSNVAPLEPNYCGRDCRKGCNLGCEKKLFGTSCSGLEIGGWTSIGYHNRNTIMTNNRSGEANVHQVWLYLDKPAQCGGIGYHFDALYGIDGQDLQAFGNPDTGNPTGWDNSWDNGAYGFALPTAYLQFAVGDWDVKMGKFFSPFGYESIAAKDNFFYSHSYTMYYTEPFTMSGILGEKQVSDKLTTVLGVTAGWDTGFESNTQGLTLITGSRYQYNDYVNLAITSSYGDAGARNNGSMTSAVAQLQLTEEVKYVFQADWLDLEDNQDLGFIHYLFRDINPCLALGTRLEWWKSDQFGTGSQSTYEFTMGANYRPHANIVLRPEVRFDWGEQAIDPGEAIVGIDAVMTF